MAASSSNQAPPHLTEPPRLLVEKVLCETDITRRLVLPKNKAEANMPPLAVNEVQLIQLYDDKITFWTFLYRCWKNPTSKTKSYYIERAGPYFERYDLRPNDRIMIHEEGNGVLTIGYRKACPPLSNRFWNSIAKEVSWLKRPRYSEIFPLWLDASHSPTELNPAFLQAVQPIPSQAEPQRVPSSDPDS